MKVLLFAVMGIMLSGVAQAVTQNFTLSSNDALTASMYVGEVCSSNGNRVIACKCAAGQTVNLPAEVEDCVVGGSFQAWGCRFTGTFDNGKNYFCSSGWDDMVCNMCGCGSMGVPTSWSSAGSNRVSRNVRTNTEVGGPEADYRCSVSQTVEYGCSANYYTDASSPSASMTCKTCPSSGGVSGLSAVGNTAITGCYIPDNTALTDTTGSYTYTSKCYYTK